MCKEPAIEDAMILFRTDVSSADDEFTDGECGNSIGEGTGTARGTDGGDGSDAIGTASCSDVIGSDGGYGGTAAAGTDVEVGQEGEKGETVYRELVAPDRG